VTDSQLFELAERITALANGMSRRVLESDELVELDRVTGLVLTIAQKPDSRVRPDDLPDLLAVRGEILRRCRSRARRSKGRRNHD
jgi:hypothetical protein